MKTLVNSVQCICVNMTIPFHDDYYLAGNTGITLQSNKFGYLSWRFIEFSVTKVKL